MIDHSGSRASDISLGVLVFAENVVLTVLSVGSDIFKVNNRNTRTMWEICSKSTVKTPELFHNLF